MFLLLLSLLIIGIIGTGLTFLHLFKAAEKHENQRKSWEKPYWHTDSHKFHFLIVVMFTAFALMGGLGMLASVAGTL